jgi:hypothetical protein
MTEVALWDILRPVLIVKKTTGVLYYNQVGGCGCYHKSQEGYLIPLLGIDPMEHRTFNHHVWYASYHSAVPPDLTTNIPFPGFKATEKESRTWSEQMWWDEVVETIEGLRERDTQARDFIRMKVKKQKETEHYEAWIEVRALIHTRQHNWSRILKTGVKRTDSKEWVDAVLTWQNCD